MLRNILAVIAGLFVGSLVNMAIIQLNMRVLFPVPEGVDLRDMEQLTAHMQTLPVTAFLVVMVAHLGQAFVGGWVAARLAAVRPMILAMIVGGVSLAGGISAMLMIDGPGWMAVELPLYLVAAWLAGSIELRRRAGLEDAPSSLA
jgi:hypothetical protein